MKESVEVQWEANLTPQVSTNHSHHLHSSLWSCEVCEQLTAVLSVVSGFYTQNWKIWHRPVPHATILWIDIVFNRMALQISTGFSLQKQQFQSRLGL